MELDGEVEHYGFAEQVAAARGGWLQGRYYSDEGETVADLLSFSSVFEINPFEVGASHAKERRAFAERKKVVERLLDVRELARRAFTSLSNGEMRRVLFARALLKGPAKLSLDDPMGGLDPSWRERMREIINALRRRGMEIVAPAEGKIDRKPRIRSGRRPAKDAPVLVEMRNVNVAFGHRVLFKDFSWTIREGDRWILRGPNGCGKTTLLSLITGDSPRSYAFDVTVFGKKRGEEGSTLAAVRAKIGMVSPEQQVYLCETPDALLSAALAKNPKLLLLDEPCCNLPPKSSRRLLRRISAWLKAHPRAAAVCVAHRPEHVPNGFSQEIQLNFNRRANL